MRKPTHADAELLIRLFEVRREPELRRARRWFLSEFKPTTWADIKANYLNHHDEDRWYRMTLSYWDMVATMVNRGVLHAELFFDHTGEDIATWERVKTLVPGARAESRPTYLMQFEKLVHAHQAYRQKLNDAARAASKPTNGAAAGATRAAKPGALAARAGGRARRR